MHYESAKETWDALEKLYDGDGKLKKVRLQALRRQYEVLTMEEDETVSQYFDKVINLINQMTRNGETVTDVMKVEKVLKTLTSRFDHIVVALEESKDLDSMKIEELQASLEAHELRLIDRNRERGKSVSSDQALQAQYEKRGKFKKGKKPWNNQSHKDGEGSSKNQEKNDVTKSDQKKKKDKRDIQCYNCQKMGHYAFECRSKRVPRNKDEAQFAQNEGSDSEEVLLMATVKEEEERSDEWYLDTGCSNHMTGKKSWFSELDDPVNRKIRFADNSIVCAAGIGKVLIHRKDGKKSCITDVLYVPNMRSNLISIGQLLQKGYIVKVEAQTMKVFDSKNRLILKAPLSKQRTFKINIIVIDDKCLLSEVKSEN